MDFFQNILDKFDFWCYNSNMEYRFVRTVNFPMVCELIIMTENRDISEISDMSDEELLREGADGEVLAEIVSRYSHMVFALAREFSGADYDELVSDGMQALLAAADSYDPKKGRFSAYAGVCVSNRMKNTVQRARRYAAKLTDAEQLELMPDSSPSPEETVIGKESYEELHRLIANELTPLERSCISGVIFGMSYDEIAQKIGATKKSVDNAVARARSKLKKLFGRR